MHRALGNAGLWCIGRLQTDADRERVIDGLATSTGFGDLLLPIAGDAKKRQAAARARTRERSDRAYLADIVRRLPPRWFLVRDVHDESARGSGGMRLVQSRQTMSFLRGPMTKIEIARVLGRSAT